MEKRILMSGLCFYTFLYLLQILAAVTRRFFPTAKDYLKNLLKNYCLSQTKTLLAPRYAALAYARLGYVKLGLPKVRLRKVRLRAVRLRLAELRMVRLRLAKLLMVRLRT